MSGQGGDKTEAPTPKRRRDARRDGQISKSSEIASWGGTLVATYLVQLTAGTAGRRLTSLLDDTMLVVEEPEIGPAMSLLGDGAVSGLVIVAPLALGLLVLGVALNLAQVGWTPSGKLLKPKIERINPLKGFKRLLGPQSLWEAAKTMLKVAILAFISYRAVMDIVPQLLGAGRQSVGASISFAAERTIAMVRSVAYAGLGLALVDYGLQRRRVAKNMKMTKQEVRDEHRQSEGDPQMRGAIRSKQLSISRNRMMAEVAGADVVLVNPTHVAVAIRYRAEGGAPRVVAKGAGVVAARIREEAETHGVPMIQDVPLARAIYKACDLGHEIPAELYDAVARVLAFIFALQRKGAARGMHTLPAALAAS